MDSFNGKRFTPKLKESALNRNKKQDSEEEFDCPDIEYTYGDTDTHLCEIAELYSYSELEDFQTNIQEFEKVMQELNLKPAWHSLSMDNKNIVLSKLLDLLEVSDSSKRMNAARCVLYLLQGSWAECQSDRDQQMNSKENVLFLYKFGVYNIFVNLLNMEIDSVQSHRKTQTNCTDSMNLRLILNVLYTFIEVLRISEFETDVEINEFRNNLLLEIGLPHNQDHIILKLQGMITKFCSGLAPHYPMKKVLLLLWKLILVILGGMNKLANLKNEYRKNVNLSILQEDPIEIIKSMRSSSPPPSSTDLINAQKRGNRQKRSLIKQSSLDESIVVMDLSYQNDDDLSDYEDQQLGMEEITNVKNIPEMSDYLKSELPPSPLITKGLPWIPKVRHKELQFFLDQTRIKFLGYKLENDTDTLIGLPEPIHESVSILKQYLYTSLADYQIKREEMIQKNPMILGESDYYQQSPAEILYKAMLPNLPTQMIALLKILLAASPTSKAKSDSINIVADILPVNVPVSFSESVKLETDINRQKEIVVKAISGILILLLKHFKANHIYQFEFISQHLVFANCIPLVIKFLNQNLVTYISSKNTIPLLDFPTCVIGQGPDLDNIEVGEFPLCSWRNVYSCINLLRVLNKITKWKHSRIMMLVIFKSAPILKKSLKVRHAMMQNYILKLLKMQAKYLGRAWRKSNMKTMSNIYQKVRHRLNDDWAYGNDLEARPTDFQIEERFLRSAVDKFHARRYSPKCVSIYNTVQYVQ
ncbi:Hypothetical protein CINCED_3A007437 [Cinara cedri]|uniref:Uncharacterized protein n=1 Tax=Cinara cedri TaxID=506608 RepID=A0A5E4MY23_9HEMI|nr:Hypothetical protein CINCED_3A007437 [Cinara cedri]